MRHSLTLARLLTSGTAEEQGYGWVVLGFFQGDSQVCNEWQILKVNASATTFCRLFCSGTFWRPKKVADLLASFWCLFDILLEDKKRFATFGRQKVAVEKRRQKVVALAFSFSTPNYHTSTFGGQTKEGWVSALNVL